MLNRWNLIIGESAGANSNTVLVSGIGSSLTAAASTIYVGKASGTLGNQLIISNGGKVYAQNAEISTATNSTNSVLVADANSLWSNSGTVTVGNAGRGSLLVTNGASVVSSNLTVGLASTSSNNSVLITGNGSSLSNRATITIGSSGSGSLTVTNGGSVISSNVIVGSQSNSTGLVTVASGGSLRATNVSVGAAGSGTLTVAGNGTLSASQITIASSNNSTGNLNIGAYGGSDANVTVGASTITFGSGSGTLNFNQADTQSNAITITGSNATLAQLGSGTTILSGSNGYTGTTRVEAGRLVTISSNALGGSSVSLNGGTLDLLNALTVSNFTWNSSALLMIDDADGGTNYLTATGDFSLSGSGTNTFSLKNFTLGVDPTKLIQFGSSSLTSTDTNLFAASGLANYAFSITNNALYIYLTALAVDGTTVIASGDRDTYPLIVFGTNSTLVIDTNATLNIQTNVTVSNNSTVMVRNNANFSATNTITVNNGSTLAGSGTVTAQVVVNGQLGATNSTGGLTINGNLSFGTNGAYLWNLYSNSTVNPGTNYSAPVVVSSNASFSNGSSFSMLFAPAVAYYDSFWSTNRSWTIMNAGSFTGITNLAPAFASNSAPGFSISTFSISGSGTNLVLHYTAPFVTNPVIGPGTNDLPSYNTAPADVVITAPPGSTAVLANSNPSLVSITLNSGSLLSPTNTALPTNCNVTVNGGAMGFEGSGVNYINGLLLTDGTLSTGSNTTVAVRNFLVTGGELAGSGSATYWADNYYFAATNDATVNARLANLGTVANFRSTAVVTTNASGAPVAPVIFENNMSYEGGTVITGGILQLGGSSSTSPVTIQGIITNNGFLNFGFNGNSTTPTNEVIGNGVIGQVGTGTLTVGSNGITGSFTGSFAAANGTLAITTNSALGSSTNFYLSSNGTLQATAGVTNITNVNVTSGTGIIENASGGMLALEGTLRKSGSVLVLAGGRFDVNARITGSGAPGSFNSDLVVSNASVLLNAGNNNYTGPTTLIAGSALTNGIDNALPSDTLLTLGATGDFSVNRYDMAGYDQTLAGLASAGSTANFVTNSGVARTLTVNGAQATTYAGLIRGDIALVRGGSGSTLLSGANTYTGGTTINGGKLITANTSALGSGTATLNGGILQLNSLLTVSALNWASNAAVIALPTAVGTASYLDVTGSVTLGNSTGNTFDMSGAMLTTEPTKLLAYTTNNLTAGMFAVTGVRSGLNYSLYTLDNALWLTLVSTDLQVSGPNSFNTYQITGPYTLSGPLVVTGVNGYTLQYGDRYQFISATGGLSGAYSSIEMPTNYRGRFLLGNNNTTGTLLVAPSSYTLLAANRNQTNVATALNSFIPYTSGDQMVVSMSLDSLTATQYNQAFNAIMPNFYQQIATIAFNNANAQNMQLVQRLWGLRVAEGGGFSMSGLSDNMPLLEGQGDGKGVQDSKKDILRPGLDNRWGMFVDGNGIFAQANSGNMLPGYNSQSGGVTTGLTFRVNPKLSVGAYTGYQGTYTKSGADGSGLGTGSRLIDNAVRFGVFGTYGQKDGKGLFVNALAGGGYHNFQATRVIEYTGMNRTANSAPGAGELDTMLAAGYDIQKGKFTFGPTASLQYTYIGVNSLNETGAQSLSFNSGGWNSSSMLSSVGAHAAYSWVASKNILVVPQVNLSWQHEFMQNPYAISGNLGGTSPTFSNWSATPIRDFLYTGVGFTVEFAKRWNTSFFYNAAAGNSDLVSQNIFWSAGVKF
jgi:T5SS/PEP-CTERM-associated repeat protein/autotransporter-associated beta strand protein